MPEAHCFEIIYSGGARDFHPCYCKIDKDHQEYR